MKAVLVALMVLSGCAYEAPVPVRTDMRVIIKAPQDYADDKMGTATYLPATNTCIVTLRQYPECLLHEIRHCFEGQWHPGRTSDEDC